MRKRKIIVALIALLLCGCGAEETMETVADEIVVPALAQMRSIYVELPSETASPAVESGADRLYQCETYDIRVQTLSAGDFNSTVRSLSGYDKDSLTVMHTVRDGFDCYEFVWACAGESGDQVGRAMVLSDGSYHYCVSVLGDADYAAENQVYWQCLFDSVVLG
jgi:hypothetical protein